MRISASAGSVTNLTVPVVAAVGAVVAPGLVSPPPLVAPGDESPRVATSAAAIPPPTTSTPSTGIHQREPDWRGIEGISVASGSLGSEADGVGRAETGGRSNGDDPVFARGRLIVGFGPVPVDGRIAGCDDSRIAAFGPVRPVGRTITLLVVFLR